MLVSLAYYFLPWRSSAEYDFQKTIQALTGHVFFSTIASFSCSLSCHHQLVLSSSLFPLNIFSLCFNAIISRTYMVFFFPSYSLSTLPFYPLYGLIMSAPDIDYTSFSALLSPFFLLFCSVLLFFSSFLFLSLCLCHAHTKKKNGHFCNNSY